MTDGTYRQVEYIYLIFFSLHMIPLFHYSITWYTSLYYNLHRLFVRSATPKRPTWKT